MAPAMGSDDLELFERSIHHATTSHTGAELDRALDDLGWRDALDVDRRAVVSLVFERQGAATATSSALDHVVAGALGLGLADGAIGETTGVVWPALGRWAPPAARADGQVRISGLASAALASTGRAVVVASAGDPDTPDTPDTPDGESGGETERAVAFVVPTSRLTIRPIHGIDPWMGLLEVAGVADVTDVTDVVDPADVTRVADVGGDADGDGGEAVGTELPPAAWASAVTGAQLAVAHELIGASRTMLRLAREHALERIQFGRPISEFQAVRHRLADTLVAIETADAMVAVAWEDGTATSAAMAKALAGRGARTAARHCQQVLAGIGFTTEHDLHRSIRRVLVLDQLFGSADALTRSLGQDLLAHRQLPPLLPL
jgi:alkylation response protein AidB-like acyl-CoA dehydrogenase